MNLNKVILAGRVGSVEVKQFENGTCYKITEDGVKHDFGVKVKRERERER